MGVRYVVVLGLRKNIHTQKVSGPQIRREAKQ